MRSFPRSTRREAKDYLRRIHGGFAVKTLFQWGIERKEDGRLIGSAYWKMGYMGEALPAVIEFAFRRLKMRRIEADVDPRNDRSLRTLGRHGFQREGLLRERWNVGGEIQDTALLGLLARDWRGWMRA